MNAMIHCVFSKDRVARMLTSRDELLQWNQRHFLACVEAWMAGRLHVLQVWDESVGVDMPAHFSMSGSCPTQLNVVFFWSPLWEAVRESLEVLATHLHVTVSAADLLDSPASCGFLTIRHPEK